MKHVLPRFCSPIGERRDWLLSKLYRLDVREVDIKDVLAAADDPAAGLARLVLDRHYERRAARAKHTPMAEAFDAELGDMGW